MQSNNPLVPDTNAASWRGRLLKNLLHVPKASHIARAHVGAANAININIVNFDRTYSLSYNRHNSVPLSNLLLLLSRSSIRFLLCLLLFSCLSSSAVCFSLPGCTAPFYVSIEATKPEVPRQAFPDSSFLGPTQEFKIPGTCTIGRS